MPALKVPAKTLKPKKNFKCKTWASTLNCICASNSMTEAPPELCFPVPTGAQPFQPSQARASHSSPPAQHRANQGQSHGHGPNNSRSMCDRGMHIYGSNQAHNMQPVAPHPGAVPVSHLSASALGACGGSYQLSACSCTWHVDRVVPAAHLSASVLGETAFLCTSTPFTQLRCIPAHHAGSHHTSNARSTTPSRGPMNPSQAQEAHQLGVGRAGTGRLFVGEPLRQQLAAAAFAAQAQARGWSRGGGGVPGGQREEV